MYLSSDLSCALRINLILRAGDDFWYVTALDLFLKVADIVVFVVVVLV